MKKLFVALMALGTIGSAIAQTAPKENRQQVQADKERHQDKMERMKAELQLTLEQERRIRDLQERSKAQKDANRSRMQKNREDMKAEMKKILTPEQYAKWENSRKQGKGKHSQHRGK